MNNVMRIFFLLCDMLDHLNDLNLQLQAKNMFVFQLMSLIKAFKMKLSLFENQLAKGDMSYFLICHQNIIQWWLRNIRSTYHF